MVGSLSCGGFQGHRVISWAAILQYSDGGHCCAGRVGWLWERGTGGLVGVGSRVLWGHWEGWWRTQGMVDWWAGE